MKFLGRGGVTVKPIDLLSIAVKEEQERRSGNIVFPEDRFPGLVAPAGPVEDKILFNKLAELGIAVILLTQQFAAPSAAGREKVQKKELSLGFGLRQSIVDRACHPGLGGKDRREDQEADENERFFHFDTPL